MTHDDDVATDIWVPQAWHSGAPYSPGLRMGEWLFLSGAVPIDPADGSTVPGGIAEQTERVLDNLALVLEQSGGALSNVVKTTVFLIAPELAAGMNQVYARRFSKPRPARSTVVVGPLARPEFLLEIEAIARLRA